MQVAGLVPFTTIDFPGRLAAVVFFQGCPLKCPFCHNPDLQEVGEISSFTWEETIDFLGARKKRLDGVVLSGGEPLMQSALLKAVKTIRDMGFQVALHTAGVYPEKLKLLLPFIDWVGLDVKAPVFKYDLLTGRSHMAEKVQESLSLLLKSGKSFEVRTTADPRFLTKNDIRQLAVELKEMGVQTYTLQKYRTFDKDQNPPQQSEINQFFNDEGLISFLKESFPTFAMR